MFVRRRRFQMYKKLTSYSNVYRQRGSIRIKKILVPYEFWISKNVELSNRKVLDFGSNINSPFFLRSKKVGAKYYGYDIDEKTTRWLKENKCWVDFWQTKEKFDVINASQVYEHLTVDNRMRFCRRAKELLTDKGVLSIDFPYIENLLNTKKY